MGGAPCFWEQRLRIPTQSGRPTTRSLSPALTSLLAAKERIRKKIEEIPSSPLNSTYIVPTLPSPPPPLSPFPAVFGWIRLSPVPFPSPQSFVHLTPPVPVCLSLSNILSR